MALHDSQYLPNIGEMPCQPVQHSFPQEAFGETNVSHCAFQGSWFAKWKWLYYDFLTDTELCHTCILAVKTGKVKLITGNVQESTFVSKGFGTGKMPLGFQQSQEVYHT